jgi:hypothetical protein
MEDKKEAVIGACNEVGLEVKAEKAKHMLMFCHRKGSQNHVDMDSNPFKFWQISDTLEQG